MSREAAVELEEMGRRSVKPARLRRSHRMIYQGKGQ